MTSDGTLELRGARAPRRSRGWSWRLAAVATTALLAVPSLPSAAAFAEPASTERLIVRAESGASLADVEQAVASLGGDVVLRLDLIDGVVATLPVGRAGALATDPSVAAVTPDGSVELAGDDRGDDRDDRDDRDEWDGAGAATTMEHVTQVIGARDLWRRGVTGAGIGVALIDSGVVGVPGLTAGNVVNGPDLSFESQSDTYRNLDTYGHGTHMAGIVAGQDPGRRTRNGGFGPRETEDRFLGVAPDATLLSLKVATVDGATDVSQVIAAIDWVVTHRNDPGLNLRVLNLSFGTDSTQSYLLDPLAYAVEAAWRNGIVVVVSGGNDGFTNGRLSNPAVNPFVIAVAAADTRNTLNVRDDVIADFSSRGDGVRNPDIAAPGKSIAALRDPESYIDTEYPAARVDERFFKGSGTSQAAAVVSGAVALLLQQRPELTPDQVKALLRQTAMPMPTAGAAAAGAGLFNVRRAAGARPNPTMIQRHAPATGLGSLELARGSAHVADGGVELVGEQTILGPWDPARWTVDALAGRTWSGGMWNGQQWTGDCWCADSWSGRTWSGWTWSGESWAGRTWSGRTWSGRTWSGRTWSGEAWSGLTWSGWTWSGWTWSGHTWK